MVVQTSLTITKGSFNGSRERTRLQAAAHPRRAKSPRPIKTQRRRDPRLESF